VPGKKEGCVAPLKTPGDQVTKKSNRKIKPKDVPSPADQKSESGDPKLNQPWISMRSGLVLMGLASIAMAVLTAWEVTPEKGLLQGILYGLLFGGLIWVIFWGFYFIRRLLH
jgi:hypothetical protein